MRLDAWLVETGAVRSRERAKDAIKAGLVRVDGEVVRMASLVIRPEQDVTCEGETHSYVSRAALKLVHGLEHFGLSPKGRICLDLGASTGGFCEVLLESGATSIYAVDVGHGQLHESLRDDSRIVNMEGVHAKTLSPETVPHPIEFLTCDVSFISLLKALPPALALCGPGAEMVVLIKPQFEVGPDNIGKGGLVSLGVEEQRAFAETHILPEIESLGWEILGLTESPIKGGDGNTEFLLGARRHGEA